jgi:hypothetical protein
VDEGVPGLRRLEVDAAAVEAGVVDGHVVHEEQRRVRRGVKVGAVAEPAGGLLAPRAGVGCSSVIPGVDVMIIIFGDWCKFSAKKCAFFSKTNFMIIFFQKLAVV